MSEEVSEKSKAEKWVWMINYCKQAGVSLANSWGKAEAEWHKQQLAAKEAELAELRRDRERLDALPKLGYTRITDSERYLPKQIYFGNGKDIRQEIDKAIRHSQDGEGEG